MDNHIIKRKAVVKFLGIFLEDTLSRSLHITQLYTKLSHDIALLKMLLHFLPTDSLLLLYYSLFLFAPCLRYRVLVCFRCNNAYAN